jgi:hypothetical protein
MYTVRAERAGKWWSLQCVEVPEAISQVARLDQADQIREAIAWVADVPESSVEITVEPVITESVRAHLTSARSLRDEADTAKQQASRESRLAAKELAGAGLSLRDIGTVMGVSFQRAQQLLQEA